MEKYSKPGLVKSVHVPVPRRMPEDVQEIICDFLCEPQAYWKGLYFLVVREYATLLRTLFERNFQYMLPEEEQLDTVTLERVKEIHELKKDIDVTPSKLTYKALHILHDDPEVCGDEDWSLYCKTWKKAVSLSIVKILSKSLQRYAFYWRFAPIHKEMPYNL